MPEIGALVAAKYRVEELLGEGGMGAVYTATNITTEGRVALKVMHESHRRQPELARRFLQEAQAAARVRHPGIVRVFDAGQDDSLLWIAMELLEGESLATRLERGPMAASEIEDVFGQLLDAVQEVHRNGIVHRDLKPANVFLEKSRAGRAQVRLLDFGIAKLSDSALGTYATQTGMFMGSLGYMSPEQMKQAKDVDERTDVYALGVMLYECLSGKSPYEASTFGELIAKHHTEKPKALPAALDARALRYGSVALACLAIEPAQRPTTDALVRIFAEASSPGAASTTEQAPRAALRVPAKLALTFTAVAVAVLALGGAWLLGARAGLRTESAAEARAKAPSPPRLPAVPRAEIKQDVQSPSLPGGPPGDAAISAAKDPGASKADEAAGSRRATRKKSDSSARHETVRVDAPGAVAKQDSEQPTQPVAQPARPHEAECERGDQRACTKFGEFLLFSSPQERQRGIALLERACEAGHAPACLSLGSNFVNGTFVPKDEPRGIAFFERACHGGEAMACQLAANCYSLPMFGCPKDLARARAMWTRQAALHARGCDAGVARDCWFLAMQYSAGTGVREDPARALELHARACDGGFASGCDGAGSAYEFGLGIPKNAARAAELYARACKAGSKFGCDKGKLP